MEIITTTTTCNIIATYITWDVKQLNFNCVYPKTNTFNYFDYPVYFPWNILIPTNHLYFHTDHACSKFNYRFFSSSLQLESSFLSTNSI